MKQTVQVVLIALLAAIPYRSLFAQDPTLPDPVPAEQSAPAPAAEGASPEPAAEDPQVKQLREEKEKFSQEAETLRRDLVEATAAVKRSANQKNAIQDTLMNLQQACRKQIDGLRPTIVTDADVIRKTDNLLVWKVTLDKEGPILGVLEEVNDSGATIRRSQYVKNEWDKTHIVPFTKLNDHTQYRLIVYTNMNQSGLSEGEALIGDPKAIGDLTSETTLSLPVGTLEFSPIEFRDRKAHFKATARGADVRASFRCAKYIAPDKNRLPTRPQSMSKWIEDPPVVSEQDYVPDLGIVIRKDEEQKFSCPEEIEPNAFYQVQFEGLVEASGQKLAPVINDAYPAPVAFGFDERAFRFSFTPENLTVTWGATLLPKKAILALLVDETSKERTNLVKDTVPLETTITLSLPTKDLLRRRIQDRKIDEPMTFEISMEKDGEKEAKRLFQVSYLVDGAGGLTQEQKDTLQNALETFVEGGVPRGRISWQEVFKLGLPVLMSFL